MNLSFDHLRPLCLYVFIALLVGCVRSDISPVELDVDPGLVFTDVEKDFLTLCSERSCDFLSCAGHNQCLAHACQCYRELEYGLNTLPSRQKLDLAIGAAINRRHLKSTLGLEELALDPYNDPLVRHEQIEYERSMNSAKTRVENHVSILARLISDSIETSGVITSTTLEAQAQAKSIAAKYNQIWSPPPRAKKEGLFERFLPILPVVFAPKYLASKFSSDVEELSVNLHEALFDAPEEIFKGSCEFEEEEGRECTRGVSITRSGDSYRIQILDRNGNPAELPDQRLEEWQKPFLLSGRQTTWSKSPSNFEKALDSPSRVPAGVGEMELIKDYFLSEFVGGAGGPGLSWAVGFAEDANTILSRPNLQNKASLLAASAVTNAIPSASDFFLSVALVNTSSTILRITSLVFLPNQTATFADTPYKPKEWYQYSALEDRLRAVDVAESTRSLSQDEKSMLKKWIRIDENKLWSRLSPQDLLLIRVEEVIGPKLRPEN